MAKRIRIPAGRPVALKLTRSQRDLLADIILLDEEIEDKLNEMPPGETTVMLTLDELDLLAGYVAAEANHTEDKRRERKLDRIHDRICQVEDAFEEE